MKITERTTFRTLSKVPELKEAVPYFMWSELRALQLFTKLPLSLKRIAKMSGWRADSLCEGLTYLQTIAAKGPYLFPVYSEEECRSDESKKIVNIIKFPVKSETPKPYFLILAGGGFASVGSVAEGYPIAKRFNEMGYPAFVLNYRVGGEKLLPKPMDDLAAAIRYIRAHAEQFRVDPNRYVVCGFSAGGTITGLWGTTNHGYSAYDLPKPEALFPIYATVNHHYLCAEGNEKMAQGVSSVMFGANADETYMADFDTDRYADATYPPSYICCCMDDKTVDPQNSLVLAAKLQDLGIPHILETGEKGGHGFCDGTGTDCEDWMKRAVAFYESLNC